MFSSQQTEYKSLVQQITPGDIELLIGDLRLQMDGYVINYIIDPYDIFRFCFPYGLKYDETNRSIDEIGDEMIGYSYMFRKYNPIILDEYKLELYANRNNLDRNNKRYLESNLYQQLESRLKTTVEAYKRKRIYRELSESATFLLSTAHLKNSFIKRFDEKYKELQIDTLRLQPENVSDESILLNAFRQNRRSDWSEDAFRNWVKEKDEQGGFESRTKSQLSADFKSTYIDYVVFDRVCRINEQLQENGVTRSKYLFLYFSSAPKSSVIFRTEKTRDHLPNVNTTSRSYFHYDILRSVKHSYLLFLFADEDGDHDETIRKLEELKEFAIDAEKSSLSRFSAPDQNRFKKLKHERLEEWEDNSIKQLIDQHADYQKSLKETIQKLEKVQDNLAQLKVLYEDLLEKARSVSFNINPLVDMAMDYSIQSSLSRLLEFLTERQELNLHKGRDLIEGNYQHLPILLFLDNQGLIDSKSKSLLYEVIDFVVKSPKIKQQGLRPFFVKIKNLYTHSEPLFSQPQTTHDEDSEYSSVLIKSLIYLILSFDDDGTRQERDAYTFVQDTYLQLKAAHDAKDDETRYEPNFLRTRKRSFEKWRYDYTYFLIWAARRNGDIKPSLKLAEEAIDQRPNDPRFHHGKCLALHNIYSTNNLEVEEFDCLEPLVESAEKALELYAKMIAGTQNPAPHFIEGSIAALQNTILYAVLLTHLNKLENGTSEEFLNNPILSKYKMENLRRDLWIPIENYEKKKRRKVKDLPEYDQTLSILELCEAISLSNAKHFDKAEHKINDAFAAIDAAIDIDRKSTLYQDTRNKIEKWQVLIDAAALSN
jgi:hypothetical protein